MADSTPVECGRSRDTPVRHSDRGRNGTNTGTAPATSGPAAAPDRQSWAAASGASRLSADEPPLPGRRPTTGQHATYSRMVRRLRRNRQHRQLFRSRTCPNPHGTAISRNQKSHCAISPAAYAVRDAGSGGRYAGRHSATFPLSVWAGQAYCADGVRDCPRGSADGDPRVRTYSGRDEAGADGARNRSLSRIAAGGSCWYLRRGRLRSAD